MDKRVNKHWKVCMETWYSQKQNGTVICDENTHVRVHARVFCEKNEA